MSSPTVRIEYAKHLDPYFKSLFKYNQEAGLISNELHYPDSESILQKVQEYNRAWLLRIPVLEYLQTTLKLDFNQTIIDAYIIGQMRGAISTPILTSSQLPSQKYIDVLTHEIIHRLIADNRQNIDVPAIFTTMFPGETDLCKIHVIVNALMKKVYLDFLNEPKRLSDNLERDTNSADYMKSWEIVDQLGENIIINEFISHYN